jgi:hypothetical protein
MIHQTLDRTEERETMDDRKFVNVKRNREDVRVVSLNGLEKGDIIYCYFFDEDCGNIIAFGRNEYKQSSDGSVPSIFENTIFFEGKSLVFRRKMRRLEIEQRALFLKDGKVRYNQNVGRLYCEDWRSPLR